jgi:phage shock protein A
MSTNSSLEETITELREAIFKMDNDLIHIDAELISVKTREDSLTAQLNEAQAQN